MHHHFDTQIQAATNEGPRVFGVKALVVQSVA